jgi:hypothetical protein
MKICCTCCLPKPRDEFNIDRRKRDGLQSACRECMGVYHRTRRRKSGASLRKHRLKYEGHEFVSMCGVLVRKLSPREIEALQRSVGAPAPQPIRLDVA